MFDSECDSEQRRVRSSQPGGRTIVAALGRVVERVAGLSVVATRGCRCLAHLLLPMALEVDLIHGGGRVAQSYAMAGCA